VDVGDPSTVVWVSRRPTPWKDPGIKSDPAERLDVPAQRDFVVRSPVVVVERRAFGDFTGTPSVLGKVDEAHNARRYRPKRV
jgi:hypothetical protein